MVIRGGENISCPQVEAALSEHPAVIEAAVFGVPDSRMGEELVAVIAMRPLVGVAAPELCAWLRTRLAAFQVPRAIELRVEPLPRVASGKIDKRRLREEFIAARRTLQEVA